MALGVAAADELFDVLVQAYDAEPEAMRSVLLARLCLTLAHRIGDVDQVRVAIHEARLTPETEDRHP